MPARRGLPARATQQRNAKLEPEPVMRTRGRGVKSTPTKLSASTDLPRTSPRQVKTKVIIYGTDDDSEASFARPSSSDGSVAYREEEETPEPASRIKCEVDEKGILSVFSLPTLFLSQLLETEKRSQRQARLYAGQFTQSDLDTTTEEDVPTPPPTTSGRGRGRGGRGGRGRGRGGRGRGRGGAGATASSLTRALSPERVSPTRTRKPRGGARNVAPRPEEDASHSANQNSVAKTAKTTEMDHIEDPQDVQMEDASEDDDKEEEDTRMQDFSRTVMKESLDFTSPRKNKRGGAQTKPPPAKDRSAREEPGSVTPATPPPVSSPEITEKVAQGTLVGRAAALIAQESASQTPANGTSTRAASPVPPLIDPEDDILSDSDLPEPFLDDYVPPATEAECDDRADFLLKTRFKPMTDVQDIIASLTKFAPSQRSTENLYRLAQNTQKILQAWQDEYLKLDAKVCTRVICILTAVLTT